MSELQRRGRANSCPVMAPASLPGLPAVSPPGGRNEARKGIGLGAPFVFCARRLGLGVG